jgi:hypothetical protein
LSASNHFINASRTRQTSASTVTAGSPTAESDSPEPGPGPDDVTLGPLHRRAIVLCSHQNGRSLRVRVRGRSGAPTRAEPGHSAARRPGTGSGSCPAQPRPGTPSGGCPGGHPDNGATHRAGSTVTARGRGSTGEIHG